MEIRQYFLLLKKWAWLLILGAILGGVGGYIVSRYQSTLYRTMTKVMVSRPQAADSQNYLAWYSEIQLAKSYARIINTKEVVEPLSERLGYPVNSGQVEVNQEEDSVILTITVTDGDPQKAADIANTLVEVFREVVDSLQDVRFLESEEVLDEQIATVESQIAVLQDEMLQVSEQELETQKQQIEVRLRLLEEQLDETETEIIQLENQLAGFHPTPAVTNTPAPSWHRPTATPVPVPTPTLSVADETRYRDLQNRLEQVTDLRNLYKQVYSNLLVSSGDQNSDPALRQDQLQTMLALYQQIYTNLLSSRENVRLARLRGTPQIDQLERASVPSKPIQPQPMRNVLMGSVIGGFLMGAIVFAVEFLDDTLKTPEDVNHYLHVPVIGLIGKMDLPRSRDGDQTSGVFVAENPLLPVTEAFRTLRTNLDFAGVNQPLKTLLVTSASPSEGKTTIAANLAAVMAQGERRVILIDADLRRPTIHRYMGIANRKGLSDLFRNQTEISNVISSWGDPPIVVITSGGLPPNPAELLSSEKMGTILTELKDKSDIVILDTPPAIVADPIVLSAVVDGVLLVIEPGKTKIGAAQVLMEQLERAGARVVGAVLNSISRRRSGYYYSKYHYYSSYYYSRGNDRYFGNNGKIPKPKRIRKPKEEKSELDTPTK